MTRLRDLLLEIQRDKVLREFFGKNYNSTGDEEKAKVLQFVNPQIEQDVDTMIKEVIDHHERTSPKKKNYLKTKVIATVLSAVSTIGIGFTVNQELWSLVVIFGIINIAGQALIFIFE